MHKAPDKLKEREVSGGHRSSESTCVVEKNAPPSTAPNVNLTSLFTLIVVSGRIHGSLG